MCPAWASLAVPERLFTVDVTSTERRRYSITMRPRARAQGNFGQRPEEKPKINELRGAARGIRTPDPIITNNVFSVSAGFASLPCISEYNTNPLI
jgi:hypothetical protein